ncbi:MAG: hypothetical protein HOW73_24160 [Polyangiaceae bacterium]|nr:hypothetical protein [Polyangiaceae bacterium]
MGDGVADAVSVGERIVVTCFDEGVFGGVAPSEEGLWVFATDGSLEFGYQTGVQDAEDRDLQLAPGREGPKARHAFRAASRESRGAFLARGERGYTIVTAARG